MKLAYEHSPRLRTPAQHIQSSRLAYLGHLLRHEDSLESRIVFNSAHGYRQFSSRRPGAPRTHWAELVMSEAYSRVQYLQQNRVPPRIYEVDHPFYSSNATKSFLSTTPILIIHSSTEPVAQWQTTDPNGNT